MEKREVAGEMYPKRRDEVAQRIGVKSCKNSTHPGCFVSITEMEVCLGFWKGPHGNISPPFLRATHTHGTSSKV